MRACFGIARSSPFKQVALRSFSFLRDPNRTAEHLNSTRLPKSCASSSTRRLGAKQVPGSPSKLSQGPAAKLGSPMKLIDIGANLLDAMYQGEYNGKRYHEPDLQSVLGRAWDAGVEKIIITAGSLEEAKAALQLARTDSRLFCTVGVHPTRCSEFEPFPGGPDAYLAALREVIQDGKADGKVVAVGECGLDYDRLHFCDKETQLKYFERQFELAASSGLPMFLHMRAAASDFAGVLSRKSAEFTGGVAHSFDGSLQDLELLLPVERLSIGINGCSLKTDANLEVMAQIPLDRLLIETDAPWCEVRPTHAGHKHVVTKWQAKDKKKHEPGSMVKGRCEPCQLRQVLEIIAGHRFDKQDLETLSELVWENTQERFFPPPEK